MSYFNPKFRVNWTTLLADGATSETIKLQQAKTKVEEELFERWETLVHLNLERIVQAEELKYKEEKYFDSLT